MNSIMSVYSKEGYKIWIITEWNGSVTTILLPEEYRIQVNYDSEESGSIFFNNSNTTYSPSIGHVVNSTKSINLFIGGP